MNDEESIGRLLRSVLAPTDDIRPRRDIWPEVVGRRPTRSTANWNDIGVAAVIVILLALSPACFWLLLYHL